MLQFFQLGLYLQQQRTPTPVFNVLPAGHEPEDEIN